MINEDLAKIFSHLKRDDVSFFSSNPALIEGEIEKNFLSYCLEEKAYQLFEWAISEKAMTQISLIVIMRAISEHNDKALALIDKHSLFDFSGERGQSLLALAVSNQDKKALTFLEEKGVKAPANILGFALQSGSVELIQHFISLNYQWPRGDISSNPLVYVWLYYPKEKKEEAALSIIPKAGPHIVEEAIDYCENLQKEAPLTHDYSVRELSHYKELLVKARG